LRNDGIEDTDFKAVVEHSPEIKRGTHSQQLKLEFKVLTSASYWKINDIPC
jgi:hypothetical protein